MSSRDARPPPPARNDGGPAPGYAHHGAHGGSSSRDRSPPGRSYGRGYDDDRRREPARAHGGGGGRDEYYRGDRDGGRGGAYGGREEHSRGGGGYGGGGGRRDDYPPSRYDARERDYARPPPPPPPVAASGSTERDRFAPISGRERDVRSRERDASRRSRSPQASRRKRSRSPPGLAFGGRDRAPVSIAPLSAARLKGDSAPARAAQEKSAEPARKDDGRTPPPDGQIEGVDGEWVSGDEEGAEYDDGMEEGEEDEMAKMMGFGGFGSTKGKHVATNASGAVQLHKQRTWRQYMNRVGGFNRPLAKTK